MNAEAHTRQQEAVNSLLKLFQIKDKVFLKPLKPYSLLDGWFIGNGKFGQPSEEIMYKVYNRRNSIDRYETIFIEDIIVKALHKEWLTGITPYYINVFPTDKPRYKNYIVFNLRPRFEEWDIEGYPFVRRLAPEQTIGGYGKVLYKDMIELKFNKNTDCKILQIYVPPFANKSKGPVWKPKSL